MAKLLSIQIGMPTFYPAEPENRLRSKSWTTGFFKTPTSKMVELGDSGIEGDGQADLKNHGGVDKAICVYAHEHFGFWRGFLKDDQVNCGAFGENFTTEGLLETQICIGDRFRIGSAIVEVSQPRQPCWKLSRRWGCKTLSHKVRLTGKTGWYLRVIRPGETKAGETFDPIVNGRASSGWTVADANKVMYAADASRSDIQKLVSVVALSQSWKQQLSERL
jgi:MOSC domain-containing protein YiiM